MDKQRHACSKKTGHVLCINSRERDRMNATRTTYVNGHLDPSTKKHMGSCNMLPLSLLFFLVVVGHVQGLAPLYDEGLYDRSCPSALTIIREEVENAVKNKTRMAASLLRLHFHDCFVMGCDASILLDSTKEFQSEQGALPNKNSIGGLNVIHQIKARLEDACKQVVSCADILAVAARDAVDLVGGPHYRVDLGRRDGTRGYIELANQNIPSPLANLSTLMKQFQSKGLSEFDLVVLSGAHTIGFSNCRIKNSCRKGINRLTGLDNTSAKFDTNYFCALLKGDGLLQSDQALYVPNRNGITDSHVSYLCTRTNAFFNQFGNSMRLMGSLQVLTGNEGQIRKDCSKPN